MYKFITILILVVFTTTSLQVPAFAQSVFVDPMPFMPKPGMMVHLSPEFTPAYLKGIVIHAENALKFDFIVYKGDTELTDVQKKEEYTKLTKYFLASLAIPDDDQWVNLSPYEKDRIIKNDFGKTEMGRDLLAQDYMLKQITASLIYPENNLGKKFWDKVYSQAQEQYGTANIPVNTFNKVWIIPDDAIIYEKGNTAYVFKNHLKVMLEEDYLSLQKHSGIQSTPLSNKAHTIASKIVKEIVLPELEREVNEGKNFAALRQVYSGMLLAAWYKRVLKESLLSKIYANKAKVKGVDQDPKANEEIYQQYLRAYKKGVFNFIKEDVDKYTNETIPRKYFSGGGVGYRAENSDRGQGADFAQTVHRIYDLDRSEIRDMEEFVNKNKLDDVEIAAEEQGAASADKATIAAIQAFIISRWTPMENSVPIPQMRSYLQRIKVKIDEALRRRLSSLTLVADDTEENRLSGLTPYLDISRIILEALEKFDPDNRLVKQESGNVISVYVKGNATIREKSEYLRPIFRFFNQEVLDPLITGKFSGQRDAAMIEPKDQVQVFYTSRRPNDLDALNNLAPKTLIRIKWSTGITFEALGPSRNGLPGIAYVNEIGKTVELAWTGVVEKSSLLLRRNELVLEVKMGDGSIVKSHLRMGLISNISAVKVLALTSNLNDEHRSQIDLELARLEKTKERPYSQINLTENKNNFIGHIAVTAALTDENVGEINKLRRVLRIKTMTIVVVRGGVNLYKPDAAMSSKADTDEEPKPRVLPVNVKTLLDKLQTGKSYRLYIKSANEPDALRLLTAKNVPLEREAGSPKRFFEIPNLSSAGYIFSTNRIELKFIDTYGSMKNANFRQLMNPDWIQDVKEFNPDTGEVVNAAMVTGIQANPISAEVAPGGIDFNSANLNLQIKRDGRGVPLPFSQQDMSQLNLIEGLEPVILSIKPANGLPIFIELLKSVNG